MENAKTTVELVTVLFYPMLPDFRNRIAFLEGSQASPVCPSGMSNMLIKMSVEHWWHDTDRGKQKNWEKNLFQCPFVHHKSHRN